jgi:acyl carrier protein
MDRSEIFEKLKTILVDQFGVPADEVAEEATFEALGLDSLDLVEVTMVVDEELGARIPDEKLGDITTAGDAVDAIVEIKGA